MKLFFLGALYAASACAMPEASLPLNNAAGVVARIARTRADSADEMSRLKNELALTGVEALDALWDRREDVRAGDCANNDSDCHVLSVFRGTATAHPLVIFVGFTGYRHMYVEQVYDLLQAGYGPIYVADFAGGGEAYKPHLEKGQRLATVAEFLRMLKGKIQASFEQKVQEIAGADAAAVLPVLEQLPIGQGHVHRFSDYTDDVNFAMNYAAKDSAGRKLTATALSMGGLALLHALAQDPQQQSWLLQLKRIVLESPMIQVANTGQLKGLFVDAGASAMKRFKGSKATFNPASSLPEFVNKALARYNPQNVISQSAQRMSMTDRMRVWNGFETAGATYGWAATELHAQYSIGPLGTTGRGLNHRLRSVQDFLSKNGVTLISVASEADAVVSTAATKKFMKRLGQKGVQNAWLCLFQSSRHVIDQELDKYREPYLALLVDQLKGRTAASYGEEPRHEALRCERQGPAPATEAAEAEALGDEVYGQD